MQKRFAQLMVFGDPNTGKALSKSEAAKMAGYTEKEVIKVGMILLILEPTQRLFNIWKN